ncbi:MAG: fused MFS/spermidine synthase [Anaerolineales bacterium]|nr:MAG: fused MFS/spermidine synthase [Anaerolineales bacterium]
MRYFQKKENDPRLIIVAILFLLSGAAGLIYQIVWHRLLEIYFGVTMTAIALIVAAYMAGLGLGSLLGGQIALRSKRTVLIYGMVEVGIAVFGFFSEALIHWIGQRTAGSPYPLVFLLSFLLLLIPTLLMGITLPLLTQSFVKQVNTSGHIIGLLYGINTLGAGLGALVGGYVLIGRLGFEGSLWIAVALNVLVGIGAVALFESKKQTRLEERTESHSEATSSLPYRTILVAAFLVGFINLGFEMLWFRVLGVINKGTAYGFPSVLFVFLTGLAIGGFIWGRQADQSKDRIALFWKLQLGSGIIAMLSFLLCWGALHFPPLQDWIRESFANPQQPIPPFVRTDNGMVFGRRLMISTLFEYFLPILVLIFPASLIMGGGLPLLDRIAITSAATSGKRVGDIHLANILGSVLGSLTISFIFLSALGTELTLKVLALLSIAFTSLVWDMRKSVKGSIYILPVCVAALVLITPWRGVFYETLYRTATGIPALVRETNAGVLALGYNSTPSAPSTLWIGGIQNSYFPTYGDYERTAFTCAAASHPRKILIIGLGGSNTAYFLTQMPGVEEIHIVELMDDLGSLLNEYVPVAQQTFADPRVRYIADDGRRYLYAHPDETYDMIFIDPLNSFTSGHNNLYSREAMQLYQSHLNNGGIFCAWMNERHFIPKTAASVFPFMEQFRDWVVSSNREISFDQSYLGSGLAAYLKNSKGIYSDILPETLAPEMVFSNYIGDHTCTLEKEKDTPILSDTRPYLEYYYFSQPPGRPIRCNQ